MTSIFSRVETWIVLAVLLPLYVAYRRVFADLPLGTDTGYYVTNTAVRSGRLGTRRGWRIHFSGASYVLPQIAHSLLYLWRKGAGYARAFRLLYSLLAFGAALGVGLLTQHLFGGDSRGFWLGTIVYLALAAECQYGVYVESAEVFESPAQVVALLLAMSGVSTGEPVPVFAGLTVSWLSAVFVKLSGAPVSAFLTAGVVLARPEWWAPAAAISAGAALVYVAWLRLAGVDVATNFRRLRRHEEYWNRRYSSRPVVLAVKTGLLLLLFRRNPVIPLLALVGAVGLVGGAVALRVDRPSQVIAGAYAAGVVCGYYLQSNRCWFYAIPLLSVMAPLAAFGIRWIEIGAGRTWADAAGGAALLASLAINASHRLGRSREGFNERVWSVYDLPWDAVGTRRAARNLAIEDFVRRIKPLVRGRSMLVVGPCTQVSVLADAGYDTVLGTLCDLTEGVAGDLGPWLRSDLRRERPEFVLDTGGEFSKYAERFPELRAYECVAAAGDFALYRRSEGAGAPPVDGRATTQYRAS